MHSHTRRVFLKQSAGFTAASLVSLVSKTNLVRAFSSTGNRDFHMLVIGDSVLWGQGLLMEHKFTYQIKKWLEHRLADREIRMKVEAHSGATIDLDQKDDNKGDNDACTQGFNGEVNRSNPTVAKQLQLAVEHYKQDEIPNDDIDLILVDGGINDFDKTRLLRHGTSPDDITKAAWNHCGTSMCRLLSSVAMSFPNARIVVTGYFPLITRNTSPEFLKRLLQIALGHDSSVDLLTRCVPGVAKSEHDQREFNHLVELSRTWHDETDWALSSAVARINQTQAYGQPSTMAASDCDLKREFVPDAESQPERRRAVFAGVRFGDDNGYAACKSYLWEIVSAHDDLKCPNKSILNWLARKTITNDEVTQDRSCRCVEANAGKLVCVRAAAFHPNRQGAQLYYKSIIGRLEPFLPAWDSTRR